MKLHLLNIFSNTKKENAQYEENLQQLKIENKNLKDSNKHLLLQIIKLQEKLNEIKMLILRDTDSNLSNN